MSTRSGAKSTAQTVPKIRPTRTRKAATLEKAISEEQPAENELATRLSNLKLQNTSSTRPPSKPVAGSSRAASTKSIATAPQSRASPSSKVAGKRKAPAPKHEGTTTNITDDAQSTDPPDAPWMKRDRVVSAMAEFNKATQSLSAVVASGWKLSTTAETKTGSSSSKPAPKLYKREDITSLIKSGTMAIRDVRALQEDEQSLDIEKAAISFIAKMVSLELYSEALDALLEMKPIVLSLYPHPTVPSPLSPAVPKPSAVKKAAPASRNKQSIKPTRESFSLAKHSHLHCFPLPEDGQVLDSILNILAMFQTYSIATLAHLCSPDAALDEILTHPGNLLDWREQYTSSLETSRVDYIMNFTARTLSSCNLLPATLLKVRLWAIKCLMVPQTVEHATLWNQSTKCAKAYLKAHTSSDGTPESNVAASRLINQFFNEVVVFAQSRSDASSLLVGPEFIAACEYWMRFAKMIKDMDQMRAITELLQPGSPLVDGQMEPAKSDMKPEDVAALRATLTRSVVFLQQLPGSDPNDDESHIKSLFETIAIIPQFTNTAKSAPTFDAKLARAIDDLSRECEKLLRDERMKDRKSRNAVESLMLAIATHGEIVLSTLEKKRMFSNQDLRDLLDGTIFGLFALATTAMSRKNSDAGYAVTVYRLLERASSITKLDSVEELSQKERKDYANLVKVISTSYHNHGRTLSTDGKDSASVQYWKRSAELGERALSIWNKCDREDGDDKGGSWKELREKFIPVRWELLGYSLYKAGEKQQSANAYIRSILSRPPEAFVRLAEEAAKAPIASIFLSAGEKKLASIIERITFINTFDAFSSGDDTTLRVALEDAKLGSGVVGAVLEYQMIHMATMSHREEAVRVLKHLLKDLKEVYGSEYPIRRARVLIRSLEHAYGFDDASYAPSPIVINGLLRSSNLGSDKALAGFVPQYSAELEILLALQAHREHEIGRNTAAVLLHSEKAIQILRGLLQSDSDSSSQGRIGSASKTSRSSTKKTTTKGKAPTVARGKATKSAPAKTPRKKTTPAPDIDVDTLANAVDALALSPSALNLVNLDDGQRLYRLLESISGLSGLLGHTVSKMGFLDVMRVLCKKGGYDSSADKFVKASVDLAHEFLKLGKLSRASLIYDQALSTAQDGGSQLSNEIHVVLLLRYSELLAISGDTEKSLLVYMEAFKLSDRISMPEKTAHTLAKVKARVTTLERSALAANVYAAIQLARDDATASIAGLLQALRLWNRAIDALVRLQQSQGSNPTVAQPSSSSNPFAPSSPSSYVPAPESSKRTTHDPWLDGIQWRLADGLVATLFAVGKANYIRGSIKAAEYFTQKANDLATSLNSPVLLSRALAREAEKELATGKFEEGHGLLVQAMYHWDQVPSFIGPDLADLRRLQANHSLRIDNADDAVEIYSTADNLLMQLERMFNDIQIVQDGAATASFGPDGIVPALTASVLGRYIWLMRTEAGEGSMYDDLLGRFLALPASVETKVEENTLMGKLALEEVHARFEADLFLSSVTESAMAIPMGMSSMDGATPPTSTREILGALVNAEKFFWTGLEISSAHGEVHQVREAALSLTLIRALQTSLGRAGTNGPSIVAGLLDISAATTLRRELIECIDYKLRDPLASDDLLWPLMNNNGTPAHPSILRSKRTVFLEDDDEDEAEGTDPSPRLYWEAVRHRYRNETVDPVGLASSQVDLLPEHWTVVHISVTDDKNTLFISRQRPHREPLIFCLPLDRHGRRDGEEEHFSYEKAMEEFEDIKNLNDASAKSAKDVVGKEGRVNWWAERKELDTRLKELVENIEFCWLGAFKTILNDPSEFSSEQLGILRTKLDKVFRRNGVISNEKRSQLRLRLDDAIVECFSTLSPKCRDEELEDLAYFILDLYQLHGVPIALSEIDIDQVGVDLRSVLEEHASQPQSEPLSSPTEDRHTFLILDKHLQSFPWESIPILRGRAISRVPSMSFLIDRLELVQHQRGLSPLLSSEKRRGPFADRVTVDPLKAFFVLNPSGDLGVTQATYEKQFAEMQKLGWKGITGRAPTEEEMIEALSTNDLMLYFGHGGGQQYIRSNKLRHLQRCAVTMLWGCSSGAMKEMGDFDPMGTPNHYMLAGCPTLVVNLWDVTDREIDRVAQSVFETLKIDHHNLGTDNIRTNSEQISIANAVSTSREVPKLKYLTGAAPVVYGIPFYL